jgi:hypothetical protein
MKPFILLFLPAFVFAQNKLTHTETIQRSFPATKILDVDNISGSVHVTGYSGSQIQLTAVRTDEGDTQEDLDRAAREVTLKTEEQDGELMIYPDGPFRDRYPPPFRGRHDEWHRHYQFKFEMTLRVPSSIELNVRNINRGGIVIEGTSGRFDVQEVNGGVEMKNIAGEGLVRSVNGPLNVSFSRNPTGDCSFKTVNGAIEVALQAGLSADLAYKTMHGGIFTDFELTGTPSAIATKTENRNGKFVYRSHGYSSGRVGSGGPRLSFETINGEIRILKK